MRARGVPRPRRGDGGRARRAWAPRPPHRAPRRGLAPARRPLARAPAREARCAGTTGASATAWPTCSCASRRCCASATRERPPRGPARAWPRLCDGSRTTRARGQGAWSWSGTTRARTPWGPPARRSRPRRPSAWRGASGRITPRGTAPGRHMAETGVGRLVRHGLPARVGSFDEMGRLTVAWEDERNARARTAGWKLAVGDARDRLARLYPKIVIAD